MKVQWICALAACCATTYLAPVSAQQNQYRPRDSYQSDRYQEDRQERRSGSFRPSERSSDFDSRSQASDSSDSWTQWFSNWWEDSESGDSQSAAEKFIQRHDRDNDNYLARSELPSNMRQGFDRIDRDQDEYLSEQELRRHAQRVSAQRKPVAITYVWVLDTSKGKTRLSDLQEAYEALTKIDEDGDGEITRSELRQRQQEVVKHCTEKCFEQHDEDEDDRISRSEASGQLSRKFDRIDRNRDDLLTWSEVRQSLTPEQDSQDDDRSEESSSRQRESDYERE